MSIAPIHVVLVERSCSFQNSAIMLAPMLALLAIYIMSPPKGKVVLDGVRCMFHITLMEWLAKSMGSCSSRAYR